MKTHTHTHIYTHTHTHTHIYTYTHTHIHIHTYNRNIWPTANQYKHMAEPQAHSQPIETYSLAPHNRNIWPSPTPTANQYKHMAQRRIIETYGHTIAGRRSFVCASGRFFCLFFKPPCTHYLGESSPSRSIGCMIRQNDVWQDGIL